MITCATSSDAFRCPSKSELWRQLLALLPRGRAWQTHEQIMAQPLHVDGSEVGTFEVGLDPIGPDFDDSKLTLMQQYWAAYAELLEDLHLRACALLEEMFCSTVAELQSEWEADYGLPDTCGNATLCQRATAKGGSSVAYLEGAAADQGWDVEISECVPEALPGIRAGCARAGCARTCNCPRNTIFVNIVTASSTSYAGSVDPIVCLLERFKQAHIKPVFSVNGALL